MSLAESACYTLINAPDSEPFNEMQIKQDLGEFFIFLFSSKKIIHSVFNL